MERKRFIIEMGMGIDLHGEDVTEAACRAVKDAVSKSCLCGLQEVVELKDMSQMEVDVLLASPTPEKIDLEKVKAAIPIAGHDVKAIEGGMKAPGLMVAKYGPDKDQITVVNAALTVYIVQ